jgi:hypothetical protein
MRRCYDCGLFKPLEEFTTDTHMQGGGKKYQCKTCHREYQRLRQPKYKAQLKSEVHEAYGSKCACCESVEDIEIDHVRGLEGQPRIRNKNRLYLKVRREGFPRTYQLLCRVCNRAKGTSDRCPIDHGLSMNILE